MQLCDAFDIPLLFLCDTPGIMVGPEVEKTALVRHVSRMFVVGASITVPFFTIVLRKGYGLGAQTMAGGSFKAPIFTVAWPTGEFGGMGLEGAVKLGYRNELAAIEDDAERQALFEEMVGAHVRARQGAQHRPRYFEIDDVIDPADSRRWITAALAAAPPPPAARARSVRVWIPGESDARAEGATGAAGGPGRRTAPASAPARAQPARERRCARHVEAALRRYVVNFRA